MGKRFNNLEDVYNTLTAANFNFDSLPATNKYRKYKEWKLIPERRVLPATSIRNTGRRLKIILNPFGLPFDPDNKVLVGISGQAGPAATANGGVAIYNHLAGATTDIEPLPNFVPAKVIIGLYGATRTVTAASNRITGRAYKTSRGRTHTIPFGAGSATDHEFKVQNEIATDRAATHSVTFTPERLYRR